MQAAPAAVKLALSGTLVYKDKDGNVLKTVPFTGAIPLGKVLNG